MKRFLVAALVVGGALVLTLARAQAGNVPAQLMHNEAKVLDAVQKKDVATFNLMTDGEGWSVDGSGINHVKDFPSMWKDMTIESLKTSEMKVQRVSPDTALVIYQVDQKGSFKGQPFPPRVYACTAWTLRNNTWVAVYHQETTAEKH